jgi:protein-disulfide isomerase
VTTRTRHLVIAGGLAMLLVVVAILVSQGAAEEDATEPAGDTADVAALFAGIPQHGVSLGDPDAALLMSEFADPQCPYCAGYAVDALPEIVDRYVRPGDLRLRLQLLTFIGPDSEAAARVAYAASLQNRLWQFTDLLYRNQGQENSGYVTDGFLRELAEATPELDAERALADADSPAVDKLLAGAKRSAAALGVESTPSFFAAADGARPVPLEVPSLTPEPFVEQLDALRADARP